MLQGNIHCNSQFMWSVEKAENAPNIHYSAATFNVTVMLNREFCF